MKKNHHRFIKFVFSAQLIAVLFSCASVKRSSEIDVEDDEISDKKIVRLAPDVSEKMLDASYWILRSKKPYEIKMSKKQISVWNDLMLDHVYSGIGKSLYALTDLRAADSFITNEDIRYTMQRYSPGHPWYEKKDGEIRQLTKADWQKFYKLMNYNELGSSAYFLNATRSDKTELRDFPVRKAVCVRRANIRLVPSDNFYSDDQDFWYDDIAQNSGILMNEPVLVLWESSDKKWFFVQSSFCTGWIHREDVAFCTEKEFQRYFDYTNQPSSSFVTVTVDRLVLSDEYAVGKIPEEEKTLPEFFMGTYLHTADWDDPKFSDSFSPRIPYASYLVEIPYKKADESLGIAYASFPAGCCARGLLDYTEANVLNLAFKPLGIRYGWGGMESARDCSEYLKDIFRCFGFMLPRNSRGQLSVSGKTEELTKKSVAQKKNVLASCSPGDVLGFPGHVMMYLGSENGKNYVISALGSYYPQKFDKNSEESKAAVIDACSVNVNTLDVYRKNGLTWLENLTQAKSFVLTADEASFKRKISFNKSWQFAEFSKINSGSAVFYSAKQKQKNITVALNAGHGTAGGKSEKTFSHPDRSPKLTGGTNPLGAVESIAVSDGMIFSDGKTEAEVNLRTAHILKSKLLEKGYDVLMIRDSADVQLDNIARTVICNNYADIHISIHFDGDRQKFDKGCFYCGIPDGLRKLKNVEKHCAESTRLGELLVAALRSADLPIYADGKLDTDLTQTSFSTIPTVDIELGNQHTDTSTKNLEARAEALLSGIEAFFAK